MQASTVSRMRDLGGPRHNPTVLELRRRCSAHYPPSTPSPLVATVLPQLVWRLCVDGERSTLRGVVGSRRMSLWI